MDASAGEDADGEATADYCAEGVDGCGGKVVVWVSVGVSYE